METVELTGASFEMLNLISRQLGTIGAFLDKGVMKELVMIRDILHTQAAKQTINPKPPLSPELWVECNHCFLWTRRVNLNKNGTMPRHRVAGLDENSFCDGSGQKPLPR